jgi:hypothetical protein
MPYAPGESFDFRPLFEGIRSLGNNVNQFVDRKREEGRKATALRRVFEAYAPEEMKGSSASMGLGDLEGAVQSFALTQAMQERDQARALRERQVVAMEGQLGLAKAAQEAGLARETRMVADQDADRTAAKGFQARLAELVQGGPMAGGFREPGNLGLADVVRAAGEAGMPLPAGSLMDAVRSMQQPRRAYEPEVINVGGRNILFSPETGAQQELRSDELTPAQRQSYARELQKQWIALARDIANPEREAGMQGLLAAKAVLEQQFEEFGLPLPKAPQVVADPPQTKPADPKRPWWKLKGTDTWK